MFSEVLERFIQNRPVAVMVRILLESFLNAAQLDRWFDTVRQTQYTKEYGGDYGCLTAWISGQVFRWQLH